MSATASRTIADTLVYPYLNHAVAMYEEGYASREDIDAGMRFGCGLPRGPLAVVDDLGLDRVRDALAELYAQTGDVRHQPRPVLDALVAQGRTGRAAGAGFYTYAAPGSDEVVPDESTPAPAGSDEHVRTVETVGVVGSGTMATGIVQVFAQAGYPVTYVARTQDKVDAVRSSISRALDRSVEKGRTTREEAEAVLGRLTGATTREALADADLVVEAIAEDIDVKTELFTDLDRICRDGAILATTTSSLPVADLAAVTSRPQDVVGMHFFNPAPVMRLVEVVRTDQTAPDVLDTVRTLCARTRKVPVSCADRSGFIVNALLFPYLNDAVRALEEGHGSAEDIDAAVVAEHEYPMGPFALLDVVGLDVSLAIQRELLAEFGHPGLVPAQRLVEHVEAGRLGRKTGSGFLTYTK
ncbi:3-hydroxyacyl-CoA dehydrogenase NAD-binding domain-containing protein [Janibacter sp. Y6]|uniref:3-hydroxyacyl-CoA dehydrogenase NAD-binding domain-containing protein n=1 Tax=Janibacter sp. Y6 TaxID=2913552 RepID=UPI0034A576D3